MIVKYKYLIPALLILGVVFSSSSAQEKVSEIKVLSAGADVILTGKVVEQNSSWNEDQSRIYTLATVQVDELIKGELVGNSVTVKYPGGEVGEIGEKYSHMPTFEDNEEVLVFLKQDDKSTDYKVFDGENGKIRIISDQQSGEKLTTSNVKISSLKSQIKGYIND